MEEDKTQEELETETDTEETSPESQTESEATEESKESEATEDEEQDIDFKKELEKVETVKNPRTEADKAVYTLKKVAERVKEFGHDPATILNIKPKVEKKETGDVESVVQSQLQRTFAERDARALAKNEDHFKLIMHYVDSNKLSVQDAYVLSMKGALLRKETEVKRSLVTFASPQTGPRKVVVEDIPRHPAEDLLQRRGLTFNPKTKTYQGKFTEEYYDTTDKTWKSRKISK